MVVLIKFRIFVRCEWRMTLSDSNLEVLRNTWQKIGREKPYWGVLTHDEFLPENLDDNIEEFYRLGRRSVENLRRIARTNEFEFEGSD